MPDFASNAEKRRYERAADVGLARHISSLKERITKLENALLAIKHMDVLTREGEAEPHEVMRRIASEALD